MKFNINFCKSQNKKSETKFLFAWNHCTFQAKNYSFFFNKTLKILNGNKLQALENYTITSRLIDPDKLNIPDVSLFVVKDNMTVLVKR